MDDHIRTAVTDSSLRHSAPPLDIGTIIRRGESLRSTRRLVAFGGAAAAIVITIATVALAPWNLSANNFAPANPDPANPVTPTESPEWIPDHLARLRRDLPDAALPLATPDLVFLYRIDNSYVGLFEGVFPHSCPPGADPLCVVTALRREIDVLTGSAKRNGSDLMEVKAPNGAEILYRGEPGSGPIGVASYNACERIDMFEPHFECVDGKVRPVAQ